MPVPFDETKPHVFFRVRNKLIGREFFTAPHNLPAIDLRRFPTHIKHLYRINVKPKRKIVHEITSREVFAEKRFRTDEQVEIYIKDCLLAKGFDLSKPFMSYENDMHTIRTFIQYL